MSNLIKRDLPHCLVFLDVDGVLNSRKFLLERQKNFDPTGITALDAQAVLLLNDIDSRWNPKWVLSSSWRYVHTPFSMNILLRARFFMGSISGATGFSADGHRGIEIQEYIEKNELHGVPMAILDDDNDMEPYGEFLVQTTFAEGLLIEHVQQVGALLEKQGLK